MKIWKVKIKCPKGCQNAFFGFQRLQQENAPKVGEKTDISCPQCRKKAVISEVI
jgi:hypothetical protein